MENVSATSAMELTSNHEEADTRIVLHCLHAADTMASDVDLVVRSPDTDVFILLVHYCARIHNRLFMDTGCGTHRRDIDIHLCANKLGPDVCEALPALHAFTGCDSTSSFVRKEKKAPFKLMTKSGPATDAFRRLGLVGNHITDDTLSALEQLVCAMYGKPSSSNVNDVRYELFTSRFDLKPQTKSLAVTTQTGVDLSLIPPCRLSLHKHCQRVNYQAFVWRNSHIAQQQLPSPAGCGWKLGSTGDIIVDWTMESLPQTLVDILAEKETVSVDDGQQFEEVEEDELDNIIDVIFEDEECSEEP